jgi:FkbM family methyltransferase
MVNSNIEKRKFGWLINQIFALLQVINWPGKHRFYLWLCHNYPNRIISHKINSHVFCVPVDEWCFWLEKGPNNYYLNEFIPFFDVVNQIKKPITFFDLGADIGTVSAIADKHCDNLVQICAFEPNPKSYSLLCENLKPIAKSTHCQNVAVSNFNGSAHFSASEGRSIDHEGSIDPTRVGSTKVTTLDAWVAEQNLNFCSDIAIKIDVEGQEQQAIIGASNLIKSANSVTVLLEIHPDVLDATETSPEQLFETLESIREVKWLVPALDNCVIDRKVPFFSQFPRKQYDVIAVLT